MGEDELAVDDRSDARRHRVEHQHGRELLENGDPHVSVVDDFDKIVDIVGIPAELCDDERRCLVELDDAFEGELDIFGAGPDCRYGR